MAGEHRKIILYQTLLGLFALVLLWSYASLFFGATPGGGGGGASKHHQVSNKTLVVLMGNLRGGEKAWSTLYKHVLDQNHADLALLIGDETRDVYQDASLFQRAKYHWQFQEYDDWADAIDLINGTSWRETLLPLVYEFGYIFGGIKGHGYYGSGSIVFMMRWFLSNHLRDEGLLQTYERFIITRTDHYYLCAHDISQLDPDVLWVPKGEDYGGITDRHLIVSRNHVLQALDILPPVLAEPKRYAHLLDDQYGNNAEKLMEYRWQEEGLLPVQRFDRMMFTCGQTGDTTRMKGLGIEVQEGVRLKYEKEYVASYQTCGLQIGV